MLAMLLYYVLALSLLVTGIGAVSLEVSALLLGAAFSLPQLMLYGAAPLALGGLALGRGRALRVRVEQRHREEYLLALARQVGGLLDAAEVGKRMDLPLDVAQRLLEAVAGRGLAEMEVAESGQTYFKFDERRLLGA